jgi:hypothetical protein
VGVLPLFCTVNTKDQATPSKGCPTQSQVPKEIRSQQKKADFYRK